ncbi:MAG: bile acid:sodium symporter family protein [Steroidobacteraceae bacterium]
MSNTTQWFPLMIAVVMFGLGLTLTVDDFRRVAEVRRPVAIALWCQIIVLPAICYGIAVLFQLPPDLAVGLMLMAASPGGAMANILSHLADGDLALNLTLTAINAGLAIITIPVILAVAMAGFMDEDRVIPLQYGKFFQVFGFIAIPVGLGMWVRGRLPEVAERMNRPVKVVVALVLAAVAYVSLVTGWDTLTAHFQILGGAVLTLCVTSLTVGYLVPRSMRLPRRRAIAISLEIGLHNTVLAVAIAMSPSLLNNPSMAVPGALYGVLAVFVGLAFILVVNRVDTAGA